MSDLLLASWQLLLRVLQATHGGCLGRLCFAPAKPDTSVFFGFGEYLASVALMVLAWTIGDVRYRFRIRTAPLPMYSLTFWVVGAVGVLTLLTDLWRAQAWPVLVGPLPPAVWRAVLGGALLMTFLTWAWFAFIRPSTYGKLNARRYAETLYRVILRGSPPELAIAADELSRSAEALVRHASTRSRREPGTQKEPPRVTGYADDILLLIADQRFCRTMVDSSPNTIGALFQAMRKLAKYRIAIKLFARNIVRQAIANRDSFLYHESSGYDSGLLGYHKPLTTVMFSDTAAVEEIGILFDPGYFESRDWKADQWAAYGRIVLMALRAFAKRGLWWGHGSPFHSATEGLKNAVSDLYKLNGLTAASWDDDTQTRLRVVVEFIKDALKILEEAGVPEGVARRVRDRFNPAATFYDELAELMADVIHAASAVTSPRDLCWWIQHNSVWAGLTWPRDSKANAWGVVAFKLRRLVFDDIVEMARFPNFQGARTLGFCLNVMGFELRPEELGREMRPLHKSVLRWTRANYAKLHKANPRVADACLVDGITYDEVNSRLVRTYPADGLRLAPHYVYFAVDPLPHTEAEGKAEHNKGR